MQTKSKTKIQTFQNTVKMLMFINLPYTGYESEASMYMYLQQLKVKIDTLNLFKLALLFNYTETVKKSLTNKVHTI